MLPTLRRKHRRHNFNPTLVQLESSKCSCLALKEQFQSHIGAIRIWDTKSLTRPSKEFQSHIGAIRIFWRHKNHSRGEDFNPTLVQLEFVCLRFKFHRTENFNPTLVQLESCRLNHATYPVAISIPHWCN